MISRRTAEGALKFGAAGYALATPVTEFYAHAQNAHATIELHNSVSNVGWAIARLTGLDPTPWAVGHRMHHAVDERDPSNIVKATFIAIRSGATSRKYAEKLLADPANEKTLTFENVPISEDPVLFRDDSGDLKLRYRNKLDERLSSHPLGRYIGAVGLFVALTATSKQTGVGRKVIDGAVKTAAFTTAMYAPAFMGSALFESLDGFDHGSKAGRDGGRIAQVAWGGFALHESHHRQPERFTPDTENPALHRDRFILNLFTKLGLARER